MNTPTNDNRFPSHIVLNNPSQPFVPNDIDRIDYYLEHNDLKPADCTLRSPLVEVTIGPYKVCADPNPRNKYPAGEYEFPFWR
ncbi:MAG: hypothetical protein GDA56_01085 [Hormoscilla sp. GM7CHS1pb]|nr:hypothetical protein [Hormoscilla sp. GM7CHS1pb]